MLSAAWPQITWESRVWDPPPSQLLFRAERRAVGRSYRAAVPALIAGCTPLLSSQTLAMVEEASQELARLDELMKGEPSAFAPLLLRSESASSSQIEHITASARTILEVELTGHGSPNAELVARSTAAMVAAIRLAEDLDAAAILEMQRALLGDHPRMVGWREEAVWIGGGSSTPLDADYVAPHHTRIHELIDDLVAFIDREDMPVLVQAAVAHAQFETIHPFPDGNGRVGRALVHSLLRAKGLTRHLTVPVSGGLLARRDDYIEGLDRYREGDPEAIVVEFARASRHGAHHGRQLLDSVTQVRASWNERITARRDSGVWRVLDHLMTHPVLHADLAAELLGVLPTNASRLLRSLVDAGILVSSQHYKSRRTLYRAPEVLLALDGYAESAGRRERG